MPKSANNYGIIKSDVIHTRGRGVRVVGPQGFLFMENQNPGGVLPYKRLLGMCRWMGSHFHGWIDYNGVTFLVELLEWERTFSDFWDKKILVSRDFKHRKIRD